MNGMNAKLCTLICNKLSISFFSKFKVSGLPNIRNIGIDGKNA